MKLAPDLGQRILIRRIFLPLRKPGFHDFAQFPGLFYKQLQQFRIDVPGLRAHPWQGRYEIENLRLLCWFLRFAWRYGVLRYRVY